MSKKNKHQRRVQKKGGGIFECPECGKKFTVYPDKRKYWTLRNNGYIVNICKGCYKELRDIEGIVVGRA